MVWPGGIDVVVGFVIDVVVGLCVLSWCGSGWQVKWMFADVLSVVL